MQLCPWGGLARGGITPHQGSLLQGLKVSCDKTDPPSPSLAMKRLPERNWFQNDPLGLGQGQSLL